MLNSQRLPLATLPRCHVATFPVASCHVARVERAARRVLQQQREGGARGLRRVSVTVTVSSRKSQVTSRCVCSLPCSRVPPAVLLPQLVKLVQPACCPPPSPFSIPPAAGTTCTRYACYDAFAAGCLFVHTRCIPCRQLGVGIHSQVERRLQLTKCTGNTGYLPFAVSPFVFVCCCLLSLSADAWRLRFVIPALSNGVF